MNKLFSDISMVRHFSLIKFPTTWTLVLVITIALLFNTPIARTTKPLHELKVVLQLSESTPTGRLRRWLTLPFLGS
jgi:hypothetical protein